MRNLDRHETGNFARGDFDSASVTEQALQGAFIHWDCHTIADDHSVHKCFFYSIISTVGYLPLLTRSLIMVLHDIL